MSQYYDPLVKCPFYLYDAKMTSVNNYITACEPIKGADGLRLTFNSKELTESFKNRYCRKITKYKICPVYNMIMKGYEESSE